MLAYAHPLFRAFPPPRFLVAPAPGLALSPRAARSALLSRTGDGLSLESHNEADIPEAVIVDGEIKDRDALKAVILHLAETGALRSAHIAIPAEAGFLVSLEVPRLVGAGLEKTLVNGIEQQVPFSVEEVFFDYEIIGGIPQASDTLRLVVAVVPRKTVFDYLSLVRECGIAPVSLELGAHALARALIPRKAPRVCMLVDIDAGGTSIGIAENGVIRFAATIHAGGNLLTEAIAKNFNIPFAEARKQKEELGVRRQKDGPDMVTILMPPLSALRDEIKRYYLSWHATTAGTRSGAPKIEKIILSGGEASVPGVADYLRGSLKEDVVIGNPWTNILSFGGKTPALPRGESLRYAAALGLALRSFV